MNIYHYTSAEGLKGILFSQSIWMTNIKYLNDHQELQHAISILKQGVIQSEIDKFCNDKFPVEEARLYSEMHMKALIAYLDTIDERSPVFVTSFITERDYLRQWMSYCSKGGYSIGFDEANISNNISLNRAERIDIRHVSYKNNVKLTHSFKNKFNAYLLVLSDAVTQSLKDAKLDINKAVSNFKAKIQELSPEILEIFEDFAKELMLTTSYQKNSHFEDEKEVRISCIGNNTNDKANQSNTNNRVNFYSKGNLLVPYIPFHFEKEAVTEVIIGPNIDQRLAIDSLKRLKESHEYNFEINVSEAPLRTF
ncbi:DUF2971 domain-containing protein [Algicola sagamiensis]|uniref:DUF2971 domain-containing protein n=1 Tax=Algicola sagamiensis TaxID=163869 RepID=UPI000374B6C9|nr:DUF2971 domain-containing protein [Algicola sagamiensis]